VIDHDSNHGTFVNSRRLEKWQPEILHKGDVVRFGGDGAPAFRCGAMTQAEYNGRVAQSVLEQTLVHRRTEKDREAVDAIQEANSQFKAVRKTEKRLRRLEARRF